VQGVWDIVKCLWTCSSLIVICFLPHSVRDKAAVLQFKYQLHSLTAFPKTFKVARLFRNCYFLPLRLHLKYTPNLFYHQWLCPYPLWRVLCDRSFLTTWYLLVKGTIYHEVVIQIWVCKIINNLVPADPWHSSWPLYESCRSNQTQRKDDVYTHRCVEGDVLLL